MYPQRMLTNIIAVLILLVPLSRQQDDGDEEMLSAIFPNFNLCAQSVSYNPKQPYVDFQYGADLVGVGEYVLNGVVTVKKPLDHLSMGVTYRQCQGDNKNKCSDIIYEEEDICNNLKNDKRRSFATEAKKYIQPTPQCPIKPGNYKISKAPLTIEGDSPFFSFLGIGGDAVMIIFDVKMNGSTFICLKADGYTA